jgi:hypothetical protein
VSWTFKKSLQPTTENPFSLGGRGAAPPESCGGPRGYRLMLKRQQQGGERQKVGVVPANRQYDVKNSGGHRSARLPFTAAAWPTRPPTS